MSSVEDVAEAVRQFSGCLYGARYRLEVCAALVSNEQITATILAERLANEGLYPNRASLNMEIQKLREAKLLVAQPRTAGDRHTYLDVQNSEVWSSARVLVREVQASSAAGQGGGRA